MTTKEIIDDLETRIQAAITDETLPFKTVNKYLAEYPEQVNWGAYPYISIDIDDGFLSDEETTPPIVETQNRTHRIRFGMWTYSLKPDIAADDMLDYESVFQNWIKEQRITQDGMNYAVDAQAQRGVDEDERHFLMGVLITVEFYDLIDRPYIY